MGLSEVMMGQSVAQDELKSDDPIVRARGQTRLNDLVEYVRSHEITVSENTSPVNDVIRNGVYCGKSC